MKNKLLIFLLLITSIMSAQIGEVKSSGRYLKIYNTKGSQVKEIYTNGELSGYNSNFIVITEKNYVKIFTDKGVQVKEFYTNGQVRHVSASNILIKEGHYVKYYDFKGNLTGRTTYE